MDRLTRTLAGCGLALLAASGGCRTGRDEVPPGRVYRPDGRQEAEVGFSTSQPQQPPSAFGAPVGGTPGNIGGGLSGAPTPGGIGGMPGAPTPGAPMPGAPTSNDYSGSFPGRGFGPLGSAGSAQPSAGGSMSGPGGAPADGNPYSGLGQPPSLGQPSGASRGGASSLNGVPLQTPGVGTMGSPGQPPSPL